MRRQGDFYAPPTIPRRNTGTCRPSCCKTPFMCAKQHTCACHDERNTVADRVPAAQLRMLLTRDTHVCVLSGVDVERLVPQHRQGGMGGRRDKHRSSNLLWLDSLMNGWIESDPGWAKLAKAFGVKVPVWVADVSVVPVFFRAEHAWFTLSDDGSRSEVSAVVALDMMHAVYGDQFFVWKAFADESRLLFGGAR